MATKTITLEIDAYERLKRAKASERESFSSVVRRAEFPPPLGTGAAILAFLNTATDLLPSEEVLAQLEKNQADNLSSPQMSPTVWTE